MSGQARRTGAHYNDRGACGWIREVGRIGSRPDAKVFDKRFIELGRILPAALTPATSKQIGAAIALAQAEASERHEWLSRELPVPLRQTRRDPCPPGYIEDDPFVGGLGFTNMVARVMRLSGAVRDGVGRGPLLVLRRDAADLCRGRLWRQDPRR